MSVLVKVSSGWSAPLPFVLKADGVALNLDGLTVDLVLRKPDGSLVTITGAVEKDPDQVTNPGKVIYTPSADDLVWSSGGAVRQAYAVRFKVTGANSQVVYFPNGDADEISVYRA